MRCFKNNGSLVRFRIFTPPREEWKMKRLLVVLAALSTVFAVNAQAQQLPMLHMSGLLGLVETIPLPGDGYMDRLAVDAQGQRLFICGEAAKSLIVVDLRA